MRTVNTLLLLLLISILISCTHSDLKFGGGQASGCGDVPMGVTIDKGSLDLAGAQMGDFSLGKLVINITPEFQKVISEADTNALVQNYVRCKALERAGVLGNPELVEYFTQLEYFLSTKPTADRQTQWRQENPFPGKKSPKSVKLVFEPQVNLEVLEQPPGPPLRFYNFRFIVRNRGTNTADKFYYKFVFPSEAVIPTDQRFGKGDLSLWLNSNQRVVPFQGKTYYSLGGLHNSPIFSGRSMNIGNLSLMEPLKDFNVHWQLSWEGGTSPEDSTQLGTMTMENGKLKVEPH